MSKDIQRLRGLARSMRRAPSEALAALILCPACRDCMAIRDARASTA